MLILLDFHRNISSAQGFVNCTSDLNRNVEIIIKPNHLCISFCKNSTFQHLNILMPENFLLPSTITSVCCKASPDYDVKHENNITVLNFPVSVSNSELAKTKTQTVEIVFRLQIKSESLTKYNDLSLSFKDFMYNKVKSMREFLIVCTNCGELLTEKKNSFPLIFKYYEGVSEMAENWFCHKHDDHDTHQDSDSFQMNVNSLYIGNMYFYFHNQTLESFILSKNNQNYKCVKCSSILSLKKKMDDPHYIGFFSDKIMLLESEVESSDIKNYKLNSAIFSFCSVIHELLMSGVTCKMYLQSEVGDFTEVLLLWINARTVAQFLLHIECNGDLPQETDFDTKEVYKILYCICPSETEMSKKWKHDFSVEFFQVSDNVMKIVKELLQQSSKYFPEDQETIKGFSLGYLPVSATIS